MCFGYEFVITIEFCGGIDVDETGVSRLHVNWVNDGGVSDIENKFTNVD